MLNHAQLRKHYKLYRQERDVSYNAFTFAICVMLASLAMIIAVMVK